MGERSCKRGCTCRTAAAARACQGAGGSGATCQARLSFLHGARSEGGERLQGHMMMTQICAPSLQGHMMMTQPCAPWRLTALCLAHLSVLPLVEVS